MYLESLDTPFVQDKYRKFKHCLSKLLNIFKDFENNPRKSLQMGIGKCDAVILYDLHDVSKFIWLISKNNSRSKS